MNEMWGLIFWIYSYKKDCCRSPSTCQILAIFADSSTLIHFGLNRP